MRRTRDNHSPGLPWTGAEFFGSGYTGAASLIQNADLEVVVRVEDHLVHFGRDEHRGAWYASAHFGSSVASNPALIQSSFGSAGNYELVVPLDSGGLVHYWRNNSDPEHPWSAPTVFGSGIGQVEGVALIQSSFGSLEVIAVLNGSLVHFWRDSGPAFQWNGPFPIALGDFEPVGLPGFLQSRSGNFEVVVALKSGGMAHLWRNNSDASLPWSAPAAFGSQKSTEVSLIQSNFGPAGNLELIARSGDAYEHFWRDEATLSWNGPTMAWDEPVADGSSSGEWRIPASTEVVGIHSILLHTGKVLYFSYLGDMFSAQGQSCIFDPASDASIHLPIVDRDPFCGGHAFLPDGRLLVAGGTGLGLKMIQTFTPDDSTGRWDALVEMPAGRWYPTCTALPDGRVFILSGTLTEGDQPANLVNDTFEIYSAESGLSAPSRHPFSPRSFRFRPTRSCSFCLPESCSFMVGIRPRFSIWRHPVSRTQGFSRCARSRATTRCKEPACYCRCSRTRIRLTARE